MNKKNVFILSLVLLSGSLEAGRNRHTDNPIAGIAAGVGAVAGAFAGYGIYKWFTYKDARKLASKAHSSMQICKSQYGEAVLIINHEFSAHTQKSGQVRFVNENALFKLSSSGIKDYVDIRSLSSAVNELQDCRANLEQKRKDVLNRKDDDKTFDRQYVDSLLKEMDALLASMQFLNSFVQEHKAYFENLSFGKKLADLDYAREISLLNSGRYDLQYQLVSCARSKFNSKNIIYPLIAFAEQVRDDLSRLTKTKKSLAYNYPNLLSSASGLESQLRRIAEIIEASQEYSQEKIDRRREQLERDRLRIEQEKADAERRKARAEERKADAEEERARIERLKSMQPQNPTVVVIQQ